MSTQEQEHMSPTTKMERTVELIEQIKVHPYKDEIIAIAKQQLEDMHTFDVIERSSTYD